MPSSPPPSHSLPSPWDSPPPPKSPSLESSAPYLSSTSPPSIPHQPPPHPAAQPAAPSILLNPLPSTSSQPKSLKNAKRRPSIVVEVCHSPPPAHFFNQTDGAPLSSPPRPGLSGLRSRSISPAGTPRPDSPAGDAQGSDPARDGSESSGCSRGTSPGSSSAGGGSGQSIRFAPLPPGRRAQRSNSLSLGVASRAKMINAQGGAPNVRGARYAGPLQWYEGGELPADVYTWRDAQKGLSKIWKRVISTSSDRGGGGRDRSESNVSTSSSVTSGGSEEEARRMEREAKGKGSIEHIEEALHEDSEEEDEGATVSVARDDEDEDTASEVTAPRTPPEGHNGLGLVGLDDEELARDRRRIAKGKGKQVAGPVESVETT
ncbi:hypothetical protein JCM1840_003709 [Sporobolomyces johnsonii]